MQITTSQIAEKVQGTLVGSNAILIENLNGLNDAQAGDLSFLGSPQYYDQMRTTQASAVLVPCDYEITHDYPIIQVDSPYLAFAALLGELEKERLVHPTGMHSSSTRGKNVTLGENVALDAHVHLADNCQIGDNVVLYAGVYIGRNSIIGSNTVIFPNSTIRENCTLGERCIIHSNVAIGTDGFGFAPMGDKKLKIPQIGTIIIGNDVEIGSNSAIDRATCGITRIGNGTKLDNLVQIAHNVKIGENTTISGMSAIAGSTTVGNNVTMGGRSGIIGHITIGDGVMVGGNAGVLQAVGEGEVVSGFPAIDHKKNLRMTMALRRLPTALRTIRNLEKRLEELEDKLNG